jgi:hypothetical protein
MSNNLNEYNLIAFDPGGRTGWAHWVIDYRAFSRPEHKVLEHVIFHGSGEFGGTEHHNVSQCLGLIDDAREGRYRGRMHVVSEGFQLTQIKGGKNLLIPERINTLLEWELAKRGMTLTIQGRSERTGVTHEKLRAFGYRKRYPKDEFAAMQHGVTWLLKEKENSKKWPWKFDTRYHHNVYWDCACEDNEPCDLRHSR